MKDTFRILRRAEAQIDYGAEEGHALDRALDETMSSHLGGGYFAINGQGATAEMPYDEMAICIEGKLKLTVDGTEEVLEPGDFAFMPKGTTVAFSGEKTVVAYAVWPVDWRSQA